VDSDVTLLLVVLSPVESEPTMVDVDVDREVIELLAKEMPVDAEVDSDVTLLLVVLSPVDSEPMLVEVEVESEATVLSVAD
jgi:pilus assembly protein FimV